MPGRTTAQTASPRKPLEAVGLPRYAYDPRMRGSKYIDLTTGQTVSNQAMQDLLRDFIKGAESRMESIGKLYADKQISGRQFYELMTREIRLAENSTTALSKGGWKQVTNADWGMNGARCREQYTALRDFIGQVERGELSPAQIIQRASLYANKSYGRYWEIETEQRAKSGDTMEHVRTVGDDRVCPECLAAERSGWQPVGTYAIPLHPGCRCDKDFEKGLVA